MINNTVKEFNPNIGITASSDGNANIILPMVCAIAIMGTLLLVACIAISVWALCKLNFIKKIYKHNSWTTEQDHLGCTPHPRSQIPTTQLPPQEIAKGNAIQMSPRFHAINETGASVSLGYKNNPLKQEIPRLVPPNTWTPSPPYVPKRKNPTIALTKPEKCQCLCELCDKEQKNQVMRKEYYNTTGTGEANNVALQQMLQIPQKPRRYYRKHGDVGIPHPECCNNDSDIQPFPVYDAFEEELRSSNTNGQTNGNDICLTTLRKHMSGNDGRRSDIRNIPREAENYSTATSKPVAESLTNYSITNEPMSSSTVSTNKLVDRSTQTEKKFDDFFERYGKFEPDSRPSMSWDHLAADPSQILAKSRYTKTRGFSVPSATYLG